jgi:hypothetical protein
MNQIFHNPEIKQINYLDNRFYTKDEIHFFPSVTTVLEVFPKGFGFEQWLKDVGGNAKDIMERAGKQGTVVHGGTEEMDRGGILKWADETGKANYTLKEWEMLLKYQNFRKVVTCELIANEMKLCSEGLKLGGTLDRVFKIAGELYLVDIKSSNYLHKSYELQMAAYAMMWNEINPDNPIVHTAVLWLNSNVRTAKVDLEAKTFQGVGWQLKLFDRHYTDAWKVFEHVHKIWLEENPNYKPLNKIYPDTISLNETETESVVA